ncbi:MAG TPA: hypothetical protein VKW09_09525 [bacterium]|nr:hypothetical protein [bacterium]
MRRIVHDYIAAAIDRARPDLERYIAGHLECREAFPLTFEEPRASIREIRSIKITPRFPGDFPAADVVVVFHVAITARTRQRSVDLGARRTMVDVEVDASGSVVGHGYEVLPHHARLVAWCG